MTNAAQAVVQSTESANGTTVFHGSRRNMIVAVAMLLSALLSFSMGMTNTFFAAAIAWTFAAWGGLLLFMHMLDAYQVYELDEEKLVIRNPVRFWGSYKEWPWSEIYRMDILTKNRDTRIEHGVMHIYRQEAGDIVKQREDRELDAALAQIVIERAGLQAVEEDAPSKISKIPLNQSAEYHWTTNGSLA